MPKLLLADDSPTTQKVVQLTFADEGIDVVIADDGDTAMEMYDHHHPDIVLADINIPGLNGYDVCEAIRKRESNGKTPVILLAGSFEPFDVDAARRVGANDYLTKPFSSIRRLVATVTALLDTAVRADDTAHDTVEPDNDQAVTEESIAVADSVPAPGTKQPELEEPDMFSTSDIENLYSQSVNEPGETSYAASEPAAPEIEESSDQADAASARDDSAFDDELIETTFVRPQIEESEPEPAAAAESESAIGTLSAAQIPVPVEDLPVEEEPIPQSQIPTVSFESPLSPPHYEPGRTFESLDPYVPPLAASQPLSEAPVTPTEQDLDQSADEAYFEPAVEQTELVEQVDQLASPASESQTEEIREESVSSIPAPLSYGVPDFDLQPNDTAASNETIEPERHTEQENLESDQPRPTTPWDSIAEPQSRSFQLDDANLLELPTEDEGGATPQLSAAELAVANAAHELTPDIIDQITKITATHISEEMIRAIAKRVVPKVIEEVLTGQKEDPPQTD